MSAARALGLIAAVFVLAWLYPLPGAVYGAVPDLVLVGTVIVAATVRVETALLAAAAAGAAADAMAAGPFGARTLVLVVIAYIASNLARTVHVDALGIRVVILGAAASAAIFGEALLCRQLHGAFVMPGAGAASARILATVAAGLILWRAVGRARTEPAPW